MTATTASAGFDGHRRSLWLGVALAPWAGPVTIALLSGFAHRIEGGRRPIEAGLEVLILALAFGLPLAYAGLVGLGLPLALWLRARRRLAAWPLLVLAAPLGSACVVIGLGMFGAKLGFAAQLGIGATMGVTVAAAFCLICGIRWRVPRVNVDGR
jgi:hypothetical protein